VDDNRWGRRAGAAGLVAAGLCALASAPAAAATKATFDVTAKAEWNTTWSQHSESPGGRCPAVTDGHGTQTVRYRAPRQTVRFTFVGPGSAVFRTDFRRGEGLTGSYEAARDGTSVSTDTCGMNSPADRDGCRSFSGPATMLWSWLGDYRRTRMIARPAKMPVVGLCPSFFSTHAVFDLPDESPKARTSQMAFARFLFHSKRRTLTLRGNGSWTDRRDDGSARTRATWTVTFERTR
jgi:hypothetical protein